MEERLQSTNGGRGACPKAQEVVITQVQGDNTVTCTPLGLMASLT